MSQDQETQHGAAPVPPAVCQNSNTDNHEDITVTSSTTVVTDSADTLLSDNQKPAAEPTVENTEQARKEGAPVPPQVPSDEPQIIINPDLFEIPKMLNDPEVKRVRSFLTAANILGPVSLIFGGVIMSAAALICSVMAWARMKRLKEAHKITEAVSRLLGRSFKISLFIAVFALVLNLASLYINYPRIMNAINTGDMTTLIPSQGSGATQAPSQPNNSSLWG